MKKVLLTLLAGLSLGFGAKAQLAAENFNAAGIPANWVLVKVDSHTPNAGLNATIVSSLTTNAWMKWPVAAGDSCMLTTSYFVNTTDQADRWMITPSFTVNGANCVLKWDDFAADSGFPDSTQVWVSTTAGTTPADFTTKLYDAAGASDALTTRGLNIGAYNGQTIRLAFRDHSTNEYVLMVDNVSTVVPVNSTDGKVNSLTVKSLQLTTGSTNVVFNVTNTGAQNITTVNAQYVIDAGTPHVETINASITPFGSQTLTFATPMTGLTAGSHSVTVTLLKENGNTDPTVADNVKSRNFAVVDPSNGVTRNGLIEEFSSSTCSPCAAFNGTFDPISENGTNLPNVPSSRYNIVRYQMNWPAPGTDYSYNNPGLARRTYYNCNAIPEHWVNGVASSTAAAAMQTDIDGSKTAPAFMTITGTYNVHGGNLVATAVCTPKFTITGADFSVHMAAAERHYVNSGPSSTVGQTQYYHVERHMFPSGTGTAVTAWTANTPQTFGPFTQPFVNGSPAQMNDNFWTDGYNSDLVIFVQDNSDQSIVQSLSVPASWPTGVKELNGIADMAIFPNPATSTAMLGFNTTEAQNIDISVVDVLGHTVYTYSQKFDAGSQRISIPLGDIATGIYNVRVQTANGVATQRLTVAK